jgi:hypothetical protein
LFRTQRKFNYEELEDNFLKTQQENQQLKKAQLEQEAQMKMYTSFESILLTIIRLSTKLLRIQQDLKREGKDSRLELIELEEKLRETEKAKEKLANKVCMFLCLNNQHVFASGYVLQALGAFQSTKITI